MKKKLLFLSGLFFLCVFSLGARAAKAGPRLFFDPASGSYSNGSEFSVKVKIDTGNKEAMAADALVNFDKTKLTVSQVEDGGFFSGFDYNIENDNGRLTIYSFSEQALQARSGVGELATITFKATADGTAAVSFLCQAGSDTDSAIWDAQGNDLIDCAANGSGSYTIGNGGTAGPTNTPAPTSAPEAPTSAPEAPTPTASQLPETGIETPLLITLLGGGIMLLLSAAAAL